MWRCVRNPGDDSWVIWRAYKDEWRSCGGFKWEDLDSGQISRLAIFVLRVATSPFFAVNSTWQILNRSWTNGSFSIQLGLIEDTNLEVFMYSSCCHKVLIHLTLCHLIMKTWTWINRSVNQWITQNDPPLGPEICPTLGFTKLSSCWFSSQKFWSW